MENKEVAKNFQLLGKLLELHGENPFKTRSYSSAYVTIRKLGFPVIEKPKEELLNIQGIGKAISDKIEELRETGKIATLERYLDQTPKGIIELLQIKGFGPKKVRAVWKEMGIESVGELLYACQENRLVELKGFGAKTQEALQAQLIYFLDSKGKYLYGHIINEGRKLKRYLLNHFKHSRFEFINGLKRKMPIVDGIEILMDHKEDEVRMFLTSLSECEIINDSIHFEGSKVVLYPCADSAEFDQLMFKGSASESFLNAWYDTIGIDTFANSRSDFRKLGISYIPPETRESPHLIQLAKKMDSLELIDYSDIKGVVHSHSTFSDGTNTIEEMAQACIEEGYEYLVMSDHSKAAFYANGLSEERVLHQMKTIDDINDRINGLHIYRSIECDILHSGDLDYDDQFLEHFDLVISSIHSNLKMDKKKATDRLLKAIEHPATSILGHPTGRLLLSREGYPIDHKMIIDRCAAYNVAIELNANPYRLDLDWEWIYYAREKEVLISINPDAHSTAGIADIKFGVDAARKGGLKVSECLNTKSKAQFDEWISKQKSC